MLSVFIDVALYVYTIFKKDFYFFCILVAPHDLTDKSFSNY